MSTKKKDIDLQKEVEVLQQYKDTIDNLFLKMGREKGVSMIAKSEKDRYTDALKEKLKGLSDKHDSDRKKITKMIEGKDIKTRELIEAYQAVLMLAATTKPNITQIWADLGNVTPPTLAEQANGWNPTLPISTYFNSRFNIYDRYCKYFEEQGISEWDATVDYPINGWTKGSNNGLYSSVATPNVGNDPVTDLGANWVPILNAQPALQKQENIIITGSSATNPWQRNVTFPAAFATAASNEVYTADRWAIVRGANSTVDVDVSRSSVSISSGISDTFSPESFEIQVSTAQIAQPGADERLVWRYFIEGYDFLKIAQQNSTCSFLVRSSVSGTYCVAFRNAGLDRSFVAEYTLVAGVAQRIEVPLEASPAAGTWDYTNGAGLEIDFSLMPSSLETVLPNTWETASLLTTNNQVNFAGVIGNTFNIEQIKIELGEVYTGYEEDDYATLLQRCQRYHEKSYLLSVVSGTPSKNGSIRLEETPGGSIRNTVYFRSRKRADFTQGTTAQIFSTETGAAGFFDDSSGDISGEMVNMSESSAEVRNLASGGGGEANYHFEIDAEIYE